MSGINYLPISLKDGLNDTQEYVPNQDSNEIAPITGSRGAYRVYKNATDNKFYILLFAEELTPPQEESLFEHCTSYGEFYAGDEFSI